MKTTRIFDIRGLILIFGAVLGASVGFASPAFAQAYSSVIVNPDGKVTYLGTLGGDYSTAHGINDSGQVVGTSETADGLRHAFITGPNGTGMTDLGTLGEGRSRAFGINDSGQVVGSSTTGQFVPPHGDAVYHPFITGPNGTGMTELGTLGERDGVALDINDSGQVVGYGRNSSGSPHAFITGPNGMGMTDLGTLGGGSTFAIGINDSGQVAGYSETADGSTHAFITGPNGMGMTDLSTLGGSVSYATGINDAGQVAGYADTADGSRHAFITGPNGAGMTDLNLIVDLPNGFYLGSAQEINNVVITPEAEINNLGQVIATVVPEPASYALMLAGLGLVGFMVRRKSVAGNIVTHG